jgi:hypothetical protein
MCIVDTQQEWVSPRKIGRQPVQTVQRAQAGISLDRIAGRCEHRQRVPRCAGQKRSALIGSRDLNTSLQELTGDTK